jgi:hypothetical protein
MANQQNFHQVVCNKNTGHICGNNSTYCSDCPMKPMDIIHSGYTYYFPDTHGWQQCPVCNGDGTDHHSMLSSSIPACKVCKGKRIISTKTGNPPL